MTNVKGSLMLNPEALDDKIYSSKTTIPKSSFYKHVATMDSINVIFTTSGCVLQ